MPGMAASPSIYENIHLPEEQFVVVHLKWIIPLKGETMDRYCRRLLVNVNHDRPVLIGVSFGGIIVQEMAKIIDVYRVIIISSVKSTKEFPRRMKFAKWSGIHKILPTGVVEHSRLLLKYNLGIGDKKIRLYYQYLSVKDKRYLDWALDAIIQWHQLEPMQGVIHIHGDTDPVFPIRYIKDCIVVKGGTHIMVINRYRWFNEHLPQLIINGK
jgi:pimeloyl-ACP methyl ester carboxylesterase